MGCCKDSRSIDCTDIGANDIQIGCRASVVLETESVTYWKVQNFPMSRFRDSVCNSVLGFACHLLHRFHEQFVGENHLLFGRCQPYPNRPRVPRLSKVNVLDGSGTPWGPTTKKKFSPEA